MMSIWTHPRQLFLSKNKFSPHSALGINFTKMLKDDTKIHKEKKIFRLSLKNFENLCEFFAFLCEIDVMQILGLVQVGLGCPLCLRKRN